MTISQIYDKYYPSRGSRDAASSCLRDTLLNHSRSVADLAVKINREKHLGLDEVMVRRAAMLHDIGIFLTDAPGIDCHGTAPYLLHGVLGADLLRREGFDETIARVAERHTGAGITPSDITDFNLPLPSDRVLYPETTLEKLICYADKFYSKSGTMEKKTLDSVRRSMLRHSAQTLERFEKLHELFG